MRIVGVIAKWLGVGLYAICASLIVVFLMPIGGWKALNVLTGSMKPAIQPGDLVLIHRVPVHDIKPGDVITYTSAANSKETITHRVVSKQVIDRVPTVTVKGDANDRADPPVPTGRIVGRVAVIVPAAGDLLGLLHNPFVLLALVVIPGILVIWGEVRNLRRLWGEDEAVVEVGAMAEKPERRRARRFDSMGPQLLLVALGVAALTAGHTYASSLGAVTLSHNTLTAVKSRSVLLREAFRVYEQAIQAANSQLHQDTRACIAASRHEPVAQYDAASGRYNDELEIAQSQFDAQVLNPGQVGQGSDAVARVFNAADSRQASAVDSAEVELGEALDQATPAATPSSLSQCLRQAHNDYRQAIFAARDQLLDTIRRIVHGF